MKLDREIIFNFMDQEAFKTMQDAKAAFINNPPSVWGSLCLFLIVLAMVAYGLDRTRRK